jgi:hypothetical protein
MPNVFTLYKPNLKKVHYSLYSWHAAYGIFDTCGLLAGLMKEESMSSNMVANEIYEPPRTLANACI